VESMVRINYMVDDEESMVRINSMVDDEEIIQY
jgi:hypothetical protein